MMKASFVVSALALILSLAACAAAPQADAGTQVAAVVTERQCVTDRATGSNMLKKTTCNAKLVQAEDQRAQDRAAMDEMKRNAGQPADAVMHR